MGAICCMNGSLSATFSSGLAGLESASVVKDFIALFGWWVQVPLLLTTQQQLNMRSWSPSFLLQMRHCSQSVHWDGEERHMLSWKVSSGGGVF
jgi:hypothetical protein